VAGRITAAARLWVAFGLAAMAPAALWGQTARPSDAPRSACRELVDLDGQALDADALVSWNVRPERNQRHRLDLQCQTLGPMVLRAGPADRDTGVSRTLLVVGWNVHVGGGDIDGLLDRLSVGEPGGSPFDYVLLIEEAYRSGDLIPASVAAGVRVPRRITPQPHGRLRQDIVDLARRRGLALYYVPSMRNGSGKPYEDRGNAILSTLPLSDLTAIELPMQRQRRVAITATVQGLDADSRPWRLRLATVHLDAFAGARRLWIFATGWRGRQARTIIDALDHAEPAVIGADLNTWLGGRAESAYRRFVRASPAMHNPWTTAAAVAHGRLDFMFFRLPLGWMETSRRMDARFGSDHRAIVGRIQIPP
jgi:endonuclease/exonuclease/phosphatase family metal-dependent hydrolase